jgi:hypothetical protein
MLALLCGADARALVKRFEFHFTLKHGSWLSAPSPLGAAVGARNVQELEWSALARQALRERVGDALALAGVIDRWVTDRRARAVRIDGQFRVGEAEIKLKRLYSIFIV